MWRIYQFNSKFLEQIIYFQKYSSKFCLKPEMVSVNYLAQL